MINQKGVFFKEADRKDFKLMKRIIRNEDRIELEASSGKSYEDIIDKTRDMTDTAFAGYYDGKLVAIFGVRTLSILTKTGAIWMFGTKHLPVHQRVFARHCKKCVEVMLEDYKKVFNYIDHRNTMVIRWLKWLNFTFEEAKPYGPKKVPFYKFYMEK
jgi:hypothetical protein